MNSIKRKNKKDVLSIFGILLFMIILGSIGCEKVKSIFSPEEEVEFATKVEIIYERTEPFESSKNLDEMVSWSIYAITSLEEWSPIQDAKMEKMTDKRFKYVAEKLPVDTELWTYVFDPGKTSAGGSDFNGRKIIINGTELIDIRNDPWGNNWKVPYFKIKEDGTVIPL